MQGAWSRQFEARYQLRLPDDLRSWWDDELWREPGGAEFRQALSPAELLDPEPGLIWAGFMLPDTLPLIGNHYGDWLCLRVDERGDVSEIVLWSHAGGDWIPAGANLAEALLYDAACRRLYARRSELAEPDRTDSEQFRLAAWAGDWLNRQRGRAIPEFWRVDASPESGDPLELLGEHDVARYVVARDRILRQLESPLKAVATRSLAQQLGVRWEPDFVSWLFDTDLLPAEHRVALSAKLGIPADRLGRQNWSAAASQAERVVAERDDLGWPFDVLGWAAERRGDRAAAVGWYAQGLRASIFADETTRLRSHWVADAWGKFAAARLIDLQAYVSATVAADPYVRLYLEGDPTTLRARVRAYWLERGQEAMRRADPVRAYADYYRAGWDLGSRRTEDYRPVFAGLASAARAAKWPARATLAELHAGYL